MRDKVELLLAISSEGERLTTLRHTYRGPIFGKKVGGVERSLHGLLWKGDGCCLCMNHGISKEHMEYAIEAFIKLQVRQGFKDELGILLANELRRGGAQRLGEAI